MPLRKEAGCQLLGTITRGDDLPLPKHRPLIRASIPHVHEAPSKTATSRTVAFWYKLTATGGKAKMAVRPSALNAVACLPLKSHSRSYISPRHYISVCISPLKALRLSKKTGCCLWEAVLDSARKMNVTTSTGNGVCRERPSQRLDRELYALLHFKPLFPL